MRLFLLLSLLTISTKVLANGVNVQFFNHSHSPNFIMTEDPLPENELKAKRYIFSANYTYVETPIVENVSNGNTTVATPLVDRFDTITYGAAFKFSDNFLMGVSSFFTYADMPDGTTKTTHGDTVLMAKYRLTQDAHELMTVAIIPELILPTGDEKFYVSDDSMGVGLKFAAQWDLRQYIWMKLNMNLGYRYMMNAKVRNLDFKQKLFASFGAYHPINQRWGINSELTFAARLPYHQDRSPSEFYIGPKYKATEEWSLLAGLAAGNINGNSDNDYRFNLGVKYLPRAKFHKEFTVQEEKVIRKIRALKSEINFEHDSDVLTNEAKVVLKKVAAMLSNPNIKISRVVVEGHTNHLGDAEHNLKLSKRRARAVRDYLVSQGVEDGLIHSIGYGSSRPKVSIFSGVQAVVQNRRVEIELIK